MLLAVDVGNTSTHFGIFNKRRLVKDWRVPTREVQAASWNVKGLISYLAPCALHIIICSVVPKELVALKKKLKKTFGVSPIILGEDIQVPLKNLYKDPEQVGQDRLVGAYAAYKKYGAPVIIVDFGTAITIDVVSKNAEYLGGVIVPGVDISLEALAERTALLPKIKLAPPAELIATDTTNSIISGLTYGFASLCDGIIDRFKRKLRDESIPVVATGGYSKFIAAYCSRINRLNPNLVLEGLCLILSCQA